MLEKICIALGILLFLGVWAATFLLGKAIDAFFISLFL